MRYHSFPGISPARSSDRTAERNHSATQCAVLNGGCAWNGTGLPGFSCDRRAPPRDRPMRLRIFPRVLARRCMLPTAVGDGLPTIREGRRQGGRGHPSTGHPLGTRRVCATDVSRRVRRRARWSRLSGCHPELLAGAAGRAAGAADRRRRRVAHRTLTRRAACSGSRTARTLFVLFLLLFWLPSSKFWFHALFTLFWFSEELQ